MRIRSRSRSAPSRDRARIDQDLERLGVSEVLREALGRRLEALSPTLSDEAYEAALAGVAAAQDVHQLATESFERTLRDYQEIQRLLGAFGGEMKKLDEALRVLSTYVQRMRSRPPASPPSETVH
jgi:hypothetical protein